MLLSFLTELSEWVTCSKQQTEKILFRRLKFSHISLKKKKKSYIILTQTTRLAKNMKQLRIITLGFLSEPGSSLSSNGCELSFSSGSFSSVPFWSASSNALDKISSMPLEEYQLPSGCIYISNITNLPCFCLASVGQDFHRLEEIYKIHFITTYAFKGPVS